MGDREFGGPSRPLRARGVYPKVLGPKGRGRGLAMHHVGNGQRPRHLRDTQGQVVPGVQHTPGTCLRRQVVLRPLVSVDKYQGGHRSPG